MQARNHACDVLKRAVAAHGAWSPLGVHADLLVLVWVQLAVILGLSLFLGFAALKGLFDHFGRDGQEEARLAIVCCRA